MASYWYNEWLSSWRTALHSCLREYRFGTRASHLFWSVWRMTGIEVRVTGQGAQYENLPTGIWACSVWGDQSTEDLQVLIGTKSSSVSLSQSLDQSDFLRYISLSSDARKHVLILKIQWGFGEDDQYWGQSGWALWHSPRIYPPRNMSLASLKRSVHWRLTGFDWD